MPCQAAKTPVMSPKNVTKVMRYLLGQLNPQRTHCLKCQVSVFRCQEDIEDRAQPATSRSTLSSQPKDSAERKQMTEEIGPCVSVFCHLTSVICYLTPDTRNLKPNIKPSF